jgi:intracellular sulfur oxidation DsrE/DsrF family protein
MEWNMKLARRGFVSRLGAAFGWVGAGASMSEAAAAQSSADERWQAARHPEDAWYGKIPGIHRFVFDTISSDGLSRAMQFANTFLDANNSGYGLKDNDAAIILIVRNRSTRFGYNDAMWAKYGKQFSEQLDNFVDPKTKQVPAVNIYATAGGSLDKLIKRGIQIAVCEVATHGVASSVARALDSDSTAIFKELSANLVPSARLVPAGIVAVNRAQEHGYALYGGG